MTKSKLKEVIRQLVDKILAEAPYNPYEEEDDDVETLPGIAPNEDDDDDLDLGKKVKTNPKAKTGEEKVTVDQIVARFKSRR